MQPFHQFLLARSPPQIAALALLWLLAIAALDAWVAHAVSLSILFLLPVSLASWYAQARLGYLMCLLAAIAWLCVDLIAGPQPARAWVSFWNSGVRLGFLLVVAHLLARLREALDTQRSLARHDALTGLFNARALAQHYESAARLAQRGGGSVTVGFLDIDDFKLVNDTLGHRTGDRVLVAVGATLDGRMRATDAIGRVGGDEFVLVLPQTDLAGAQTFFPKIRAELLALAARHRWPIGFSIGVAVFESPLPSADDALARADATDVQRQEVGQELDRLRAVRCCRVRRRAESGIRRVC